MDCDDGHIFQVTLRRVAALVLITAASVAGAERRIIGLAQNSSRIEAEIVPAAGTRDSPQILLIGGLNGEDESSVAVRQQVRNYEAAAPDKRQFRLIGIPVANPARSRLSFPPTGVAYRDNAESHYLWRWIGDQAPDLVLVAGRDEQGLTRALSENAVAGVGKIPARTIEGQTGMLDSVPRSIPASDAHKEMISRQSRTPRQFAIELGRTYGHDFDQVAYIPGMALIGQMRLGNINEAERLAAPWLDPSRNVLARATSVTLAGHLVFAELAERTRGEPRYTELVRKVAGLGFLETGEMKESMPLHDEMSDAVFMGTPIVVKAGKLTGDRKYFDLAARHVRFMQKLVLRGDGLYRHSPLSETAWGRGNAFPALGLALALSDFPKDHPDYAPLLNEFQQHMAILVRFQDEEGMWHEVIDEPGSYGETSATAMIGFSMLRGIRRGWLDPKVYQPRVEQAWRAVLARAASDGRLVDVCESTGKQKTLGDYLNRTAILGKDPRGGAMALLFAVEMADLP